MSVSGSILFQGGNGSPQGSINAKQTNRTLLLKQLAKDLCISERRILYRTQYVSQKSLCCCCLCMCTMFQLLRFTCPPTDLRRYCVEDWGTWEVVNLELCHCSMGSESSSNKCIGYISRWIGSYWIVLVSLVTRSFTYPFNHFWITEYCVFHWALLGSVSGALILQLEHPMFGYQIRSQSQPQISYLEKHLNAIKELRFSKG